MLQGTHPNLGKPGERFHRLLSGQGAPGAPSPADTVLYRDEQLTVCPTLGSFLPYWYLVLPNSPHLNFSDWAKATGCSVPAAVERLVREALGETGGFLWFEHGAARFGSATGCGVDHAHIHVLLESGFSVEDLLRASQALGVAGWERRHFAAAYDGQADGSEYLVFGDSASAYRANLARPAGSQFFRRALAHLDGNRPDWDYRLHAHQNLAQLSVDRVRGGEPWV